MVKTLTIEIPSEQLFREHGYLTVDDAIEVNEDVLGLWDTDLGAIQRFGTSPRRIDILITNQAFNSDQVQNALDEPTKLSNGKIVVIGLPGHSVSEVYVKYAPLEWTAERFKRVFSYYGDIKVMDYMPIKESEIQNTKNNRRTRYAGKSNGIMKMRMKVRKPIPSTMSVDHARIEVFYRNQVRTCWKCGHGHNKADCTTRPEDFINRFTLDEFPLLGEATRQSDAVNQQNASENQGENNGENQDENVQSEEVQQQTTEDNNMANTEDDNMDSSETETPNETAETVQQQNTESDRVNNQETPNTQEGETNENGNTDNTKVTKESNEKENEIAQVSEANTHKENEVMKGNNDLQIINENIKVKSEKVDPVEEVNVQTEVQQAALSQIFTEVAEVITAQIHNADQRDDSETTITASEGEGGSSQPTPAQRTPVRNENDTDDAMICEAAENVEAESEAFIGFSQLTQDKEKDKVNEIGNSTTSGTTTFKSSKRVNALVASTDDDAGDSDNQVGRFGRFVSGIFGSNEPKPKAIVKKKPKQQKTEK